MTIYTEGLVIGGPINLGDIVPAAETLSGWAIADLIFAALTTSLVIRFLLACQKGGHPKLGLSMPLGRPQRIGMVLLVAATAVLLAFVLVTIFQDFAHAQADNRKAFMNAAFSTGRTAEYRSAVMALYSAAAHRDMWLLVTAAVGVIGGWLVFAHRTITEPLMRWLKDG